MKRFRPIKHIGRKQRAAGWTLLALGLLVAGVWAASAWWDVLWISNVRSDWILEIQHGGMAVNRRQTGDMVPIEPVPPGWYVERHDPDNAGIDWNAPGVAGGDEPLFYTTRKDVEIDVWVLRVTEDGFAIDASVALWPIPLLLCTPATLLLRSGIRARRRAITNTCTKCGYSLAGLADAAACPECGKGAKVVA